MKAGSIAVWMALATSALTGVACNRGASTKPTAAPVSRALPPMFVPARAPDGSDSPPSSCEGLVPSSAPGAVEIQTDVLDGNGDRCLAGDSDGVGDVVVGLQHAFQMDETELRFYGPDGALRRGNSGRSFRPAPQASGFLGISNSPSTWSLTAFSSAGERVRDEEHAQSTGRQADDPLGGLMVFSAPATQAAPAEGMLISYDVAGQRRWATPISGPAGGLAGLAVDRAGNVLLVFDTTDGSSNGQGLWVRHDGTIASDWFRVPFGELVPRVGNGFFIREHRFVAQLDGLATAAREPPDWLRERTDFTVQLIHGGHGYALLPPRGPSARCEQPVEVVSADGQSCGQLAFRFDEKRCTTQQLAIGDDGTVIQGVPHELQGCSEKHCPCAYRWWPRYFR